MTTPTPNLLAEFAKAFDALKKRWPDAPKLPEGYYLEDDLDNHYAPCMYGPEGSILGDEAALAMCVTTTMKIGQHLFAKTHDFHVDAVANGRWFWQTKTKCGYGDNLESACLAASQAMGLE